MKANAVRLSHVSSIHDCKENDARKIEGLGEEYSTEVDRKESYRSGLNPG